MNKFLVSLNILSENVDMTNLLENAYMKKRPQKLSVFLRNIQIFFSRNLFEHNTTFFTQLCLNDIDPASTIIFRQFFFLCRLNSEADKPIHTNSFECWVKLMTTLHNFILVFTVFDISWLQGIVCDDETDELTYWSPPNCFCNHFGIELSNPSNFITLDHTTRKILR